MLNLFLLFGIGTQRSCPVGEVSFGSQLEERFLFKQWFVTMENENEKYN